MASWINLWILSIPLVWANPLLPDFRRPNSQEFYFQSNRPLLHQMPHFPHHMQPPPQNNFHPMRIPIDLEGEFRRQHESLAALCRSLSENANVYIENQGPFRRTVPCKAVLTRQPFYQGGFTEPVTPPNRHMGTVSLQNMTPAPPPPPKTTSTSSTTEKPRRVHYIDLFRITTMPPRIYPTYSVESYESDDQYDPTDPPITMPSRKTTTSTDVAKLKIALQKYHETRMMTTSTTTTESPEPSDTDHSVSGSVRSHNIVTFNNEDLHKTNFNRTFFEKRPISDGQKKFKLTTAHVAYILIGSCCGASVFSLIVVAATMRNKKQDRFPHRYTLKKCAAGGAGPGSKNSSKPGCLCEMWSFGDTKFGDTKSLYFRRLPFGTASSLSFPNGPAGGGGVGSNGHLGGCATAEGEESIHCTCMVHVNSMAVEQRHKNPSHQNSKDDDDPALAAVFLSTNRDCLV